MRCIEAGLYLLWPGGAAGGRQRGVCADAGTPPTPTPTLTLTLTLMLTRYELAIPAASYALRFGTSIYGGP